MEHYRQGELPTAPAGAPPWTFSRAPDPSGFVMAAGTGGLALALYFRLGETRVPNEYWGTSHFTSSLFVMLLAAVAMSFFVKGARARRHQTAVVDFDDVGLKRVAASDANGLGTASWAWPLVRGCEVGRSTGGADRAELVLELDGPAGAKGAAVRVVLGATDHGAAVARWIGDEAARRRASEG